jgi:hypothetical protein
VPTTTVSSPDPSPEAKKVIEQDRDLRGWLLVTPPGRGFVPHWDQGLDLRENEPDPRGETTPLNNGWGAPLNLGGMFSSVAASRASGSSASSEKKATGA